MKKCSTKPLTHKRRYAIVLSVFHHIFAIKNYKKIIQMTTQTESAEIPSHIILGARRNMNDEIVFILGNGTQKTIPTVFEQKIEWAIEKGWRMPNLKLGEDTIIVRADEAAMKKILESVGFTVFFKVYIKG